MERFSWEAYNTYTEKAQFNTLISKFENGFEQRRAKWQSPLRTFVLQFDMADWEQEAKQILDFFIQRKGSFEAFEWVNPNDEQVYKVRFSEDYIDLSRFAYHLYSLGEIKLMEVK